MQKDFTLNEFKVESTFHRNGSPVFYDPCRKIFILATPEEEVRQAFVRYLEFVLGVPQGMMDTEVPMTHFKKGAQGRADIIGYYADNKKENLPLFLVECKSQNVPLTDDVLDQCIRYDTNVCSSGHLFITNGVETSFFSMDKDGKTYRLCNQLPDYAQMLQGEGMAMVPEGEAFKFEPPVFADRTSKTGLKLPLEECWIGKGSRKEHHGYLMNLVALIQRDEDAPILPMRLRCGTVIECGFRNTVFGNAAGGIWPGDYRYFILEDNNHDNQIISLCVLGKCFGDENPHFPKSGGQTMLIVAVDDFDKRHNSLQLDLDRFVTETPKCIEIWHDGTLTAGKRGATSRSDVIAFIQKEESWLVNNGRIDLGRLPNDRYALWKDTGDFLERVLCYAIVRDKFRRQVPMS